MKKLITFLTIAILMVTVPAFAWSVFTPPLVVEEVDGTPSSEVTKLIVPNASLTVVGGEATITFAAGTVPLTANWDVGAFTITGTQFISDIAIGDPPFVVTSTTLVTNLNADLLDGEHAAAFQPLEATLTDIADGTVTENLNFSANPMADNEVADDITASNYVLTEAINTLAELETVSNGGAYMSDMLAATTKAGLATLVGVGTTDTVTFAGQAYTELIAAPGSPIIGANYLCSGVTGEWDPLSISSTTGAVATIAAADADPDTFTTSAQDFISLGFRAGMTLIVTGAGSNNGTYTIDSLTTTVITLIATDTLTADAEGDSVTLTGHIPYFVRATPTGDFIGIEDYQGNLLVSSINITGAINAGSPTPVSGATSAFATTFTNQNLYGGTFVATSDDGDITLPLMAVGMNFCIVTAGAIQVVAATNANDGYLLDGTTTAEDNSVVNLSTAGDMACFEYYTADDWMITTNGWTTEL